MVNVTFPVVRERASKLRIQICQRVCKRAAPLHDSSKRCQVRLDCTEEMIGQSEAVANLLSIHIKGVRKFLSLPDVLHNKLPVIQNLSKLGRKGACFRFVRAIYEQDQHHDALRSCACA